MSEDPAAPIRLGLAALATLAAAFASQLPGLAFFADYAPPSSGLLPLLTSGGTLAIFVLVFTSSAPLERRRKGVLWGIGAALLLAVIYHFLFNWVTVGAPPESGSRERFQIGFGLMDFSLTDDGRKGIKTGIAGTPEGLMKTVADYSDEGPERAWTSQSIFAAAALLHLVYIATYAAWACGLACIARLLVRPSPAGDRP